MSTNTYLKVRGTYDEKRKILNEHDIEHLKNIIIDSIYNSFLSDHANFKDNEQHSNDSGKRIPYMGWYWRHIEFSNLQYIPIGVARGNRYVGFMANNEWDYDERYLTEDEAHHVILLIDEAMALSQEGGELKKIIQNTRDKLRELHDYMQTLEI